MLNDHRYFRQTILQEVGDTGQEKIKNASVAIIGLGGLGSTVAQYLAASGIGELNLFDEDTVALSNLHRQTLYQSRDCGRPKVIVAQQRLRALNAEVTINPHFTNFDEDEAKIGCSSILVDGCDNFACRLAVNRFCLNKRRTMISAAIRRFSTVLSIFAPRPATARDCGSPCYACAYPPPLTSTQGEDCNSVGLLGPVAGLAACQQALAALKLILKMTDVSRLEESTLTFSDWLQHTHYTVSVKKNPMCPVCGSLD